MIQYGERLLRPGEAARLLGVSYVTLKRWIYSGRIRSVRTPTGRHLIPESEVMRALGLRPEGLLWRQVALAQSLGRTVAGEEELAEAGVDLKLLDSYGLVERRGGGVVKLRDCVTQPAHVLRELIPSLLSLRGAVHLDGDPELAAELVRGFVTLDHAAYELTGYQAPAALHVYPENLQSALSRLRRAGFRECDPLDARVVLLPRVGELSGVARVHLDCLAAGGRSTLDAVAIELLHPGEVRVRGLYRADVVEKVLDDLEAMGIERASPDQG